MAVRDLKILPASAIAPRLLPIALEALAVSQAGLRIVAFKPGFEFLLQPAQVYARVVAGAVDFDISVVNGNGVVGSVDATLAIHSTADQFIVGAFQYVIAGVGYSKAAETALQFSQNFTIADDTFGISLVQINAAGTISTVEPSAAMSYASASLALGALPAPTTGNVAIGYIRIAPTAGVFTANTTALTTIATFVDQAPVVPAITSLSPLAGQCVTSAVPTVAAGHGNPDAVIVVQYTTDGTGDITDGFLTVAFRPFPLNGEASRISA